MHTETPHMPACMLLAPIHAAGTCASAYMRAGTCPHARHTGTDTSTDTRRLRWIGVDEDLVTDGGAQVRDDAHLVSWHQLAVGPHYLARSAHTCSCHITRSTASALSGHVTRHVH